MPTPRPRPARPRPKPEGRSRRRRRAEQHGPAAEAGTCRSGARPLPDPGEAAEQRLNAAQESTAGRPALSVAEAKRLHQQEQAAANGEMAALMERARALEEDGKPNVAKIYYQRIAKHASGELQQQARARLYEIAGLGKAVTTVQIRLCSQLAMGPGRR